MSYILEALKKSQAERQLGSTPGLDALSIQAGVKQGAGRSLPLWGALGAVSLVAVAAVAMLLWRQGATPAPAVVKAPAPIAEAAVPTQTPPQIQAQMPAQTQTAAQTAAQTPAQAPAQMPPAVAMTAPVTAIVAAPVPVPMPIATPLTASSPAPVTQPVKPAAAAAPAAVAPAPAALAAPAAAPARATAAASAPAPAAIDEGVASARELPDAIQRQLPKVVFGGYIYSKNAEDRLLLVDKVLRHEGEEVAPGLTLERLLPKAAVMNFRGYRYRVAY